jgi:hypothetical protein
LQPKLSRALAACAGLVVALQWSLPGAASAARAGTISGTVPNAFVRVYDCSEQGTRCGYDRTYQLNPPFDAGAPSVYVNRYESESASVSGGQCKHDCRPAKHHRRDRRGDRHT